MLKIFEITVVIILSVFLLRLLSAVLKRRSLSRVVRRLSKIEGVVIKELKNSISSLFKISREAELYLEIYGNAYLIRLYNGVNSSKAVHFASERFTVRFSRMKSVIFAASRSPRNRRFLTVKGFGYGGAIKILEPITPPEFLKQKFTEVLVFNPAPGDVSYVSPQKTKIKIAFTGDEVYGRLVFTASTFETFVDREARRIRTEKAELRLK